MKAAVYCASRNLYEDMTASIKSLILHSDVQKIYLLIEDDTFPYQLPPECECINVSNQTYFKKDGPNWRTQFTYLTLMRASLARMFPDLDKILSLDCDLIVQRDISEIWDIDLQGYYCAATEEHYQSAHYKNMVSKNFVYLNTGVCLYNLKMLRDTGKVDQIINEINTVYHLLPEQDTINFLCQEHMLNISPEYNDTNYTAHVPNPKIIHYAGYKQWNHFEPIQKYKNISWEEIRRKKSMQKVAVYCGTRHIYEDMIPSIKSLLINSKVEKIYLLIEDDKFPYELPPECECINVSKQKYFPTYGMNYNTRCTWMVLMRAALSKILPEEDVVLSLDADVIIDQDISDIWEFDLQHYYYAGAMEPTKSKFGKWYFTPVYINAGVLLCNLRKLREDKKDDQIIEVLNTTRFDCAEQDAINKLCQGNILTIDPAYNDNDWTDHVKNPKAIHYAAIKYWNHLPLVEKYRNIPWSKIRKNEI